MNAGAIVAQPPPEVLICTSYPSAAGMAGHSICQDVQKKIVGTDASCQLFMFGGGNCGVGVGVGVGVGIGGVYGDGVGVGGVGSCDGVGFGGGGGCGGVGFGVVVFVITRSP